MILITGQARSGTTLMWRILVASGWDLIYEPLNPQSGAEWAIWPPLNDGAKQPWHPGIDVPDDAKVIRMCRGRMDAAYARWVRDPKRRVSPKECLFRWDSDEAEMDAKIPDALRVSYERLCEHPEEEVIRAFLHIENDEDDAKRWAGHGLVGWVDIEEPKWARAGYSTDEIHPAQAGLWRGNPEWEALA